jgi:hypothetical protein
MRPGLGLTNLAVVSAYFVPAWGHAALRVLTSPYNGFEDRAHSVAAILVRDLFDLGLTGLIRTSEMLAGLKMVIAAAFVAYLIEFARALVTGREANRETVDIVLLSALVTCGLWIVPVLRLGDAGLIRLQATEFLLLIGAAIVIMVERQIERSALGPARADRSSRVDDASPDRPALMAGCALDHRLDEIAEPV